MTTRALAAETERKEEARGDRAAYLARTTSAGAHPGRVPHDAYVELDICGRRLRRPPLARPDAAGGEHPRPSLGGAPALHPSRRLLDPPPMAHPHESPDTHDAPAAAPTQHHTVEEADPAPRGRPPGHAPPPHPRLRLPGRARRPVHVRLRAGRRGYRGAGRRPPGAAAPGGDETALVGSAGEPRSALVERRSGGGRQAE